MFPRGVAVSHRQPGYIPKWGGAASAPRGPGPAAFLLLQSIICKALG
jgi:hypothetical protein